MFMARVIQWCSDQFVHRAIPLLIKSQEDIQSDLFFGIPHDLAMAGDSHIKAKGSKPFLRVQQGLCVTLSRDRPPVIYDIATEQ